MISQSPISAQTFNPSVFDDRYLTSTDNFLSSKTEKALRRLYLKNDSLQNDIMNGKLNLDSLNEQTRISLVYHMKLRSMYAIYGFKINRQDYNNNNSQLVDFFINKIQSGSSNFMLVTEAYNAISTALEKGYIRVNGKYDLRNQQKIDSVVRNKYSWIGLNGNNDFDYNYSKWYSDEQENLERDKLFYRIYGKNEPISRTLYDSLARECRGEGNFHRTYLDIAYLKQGIVDTSIALDLFRNLSELSPAQLRNLFKTENFAENIRSIVKRHTENLTTKSNDILQGFLVFHKKADENYIIAIEELNKLGIPSTKILEVFSKSMKIYSEEYDDNYPSLYEPLIPIIEKIKLLDYLQKTFPKEINSIDGLWPIRPIREQVDSCTREQVHSFLRFLHRNPKLEKDIKQALWLELRYLLTQSDEYVWAIRASTFNKNIASEVFCMRSDEYAANYRETGDLAYIKKRLYYLKKSHTLLPKRCDVCSIISSSYFVLGDRNQARIWDKKAVALGCESNNIPSNNRGGNQSYNGDGGFGFNWGSGKKSIKTGKRGGKFYFNSNGNKTYIRRRR